MLGGKLFKAWKRKLWKGFFPDRMFCPIYAVTVGGFYRLIQWEISDR